MPCKTNLLGVKGCGELGTIGAVPAVVHAVLDALDACRTSRCRSPPRRSGARCAVIDNRNRAFHYAVLASLALHALLLFAFPDLIEPRGAR